MTPIQSSFLCPLCQSDHTERLSHHFKSRIFYQCHHCWLISADRKDLPDTDAEKSRYLHHVNTHQNQGYIRFLEQVIHPLTTHISDDAVGLDYGCGPTVVLADLLRERGYGCEVYDPFFYPDFPTKKYDFITSTECFEHFHDPQKTVEKIYNLLNKNGYLAIMTDTWQRLDRFSQWHYIRDQTHVSFYHQNTMDWIAEKYDMALIYNDGKRVFIFKKRVS